MCLKWLQKQLKRQKINKAKVLQVKTTCARTRAHVAKHAVSENNMHTKQHVHVHMQNLQFVQCRKSDFSA